MFVQAAGTRFTIDGEPFRVAGANNYYLGFESDSMVQPVFELALQMGLNTMRTWAFLDSPKNGFYFQSWNAAAGKPDFNDGPSGLERLDRTIFLAEQNGIRLVLPLVNYWDDFGGVNQYLQWFGLTGRERFYSHPDVKNAYRNYVEHLLLRVNTRTGRHYRDEPAILAWELANEPRCPEDPEALIDWVSEMSSFIKSLDSNHLVGVGDEGFVLENLTLPSIDFGTCHLYPHYEPNESPASFGARWIRDHIEAARRADKPMLVEEFGTKADSRDATYQTWLDQTVACDGAGALVWMISAPPYPDYDGYTIYSAKEVPSICNFAGPTRMPALAAGNSHRSTPLP